MTAECDHDKIVRLETQLVERQNALVLARELIEKEHALFKDNTERHFEAVNGLQQKMDKMSTTFATKDELGLLVKKETYDIKTTYYDNWCRGVDREITAAKTRSTVWTAVMGFVLIFVQILLHYLLLRKG